MGNIGRVDKLIAVALLVLLLALLGVALTRRSGTTTEGVAKHSSGDGSSTTTPPSSVVPLVTASAAPSSTASSAAPSSTASSATASKPPATTDEPGVSASAGPVQIPGPVSAVGDSIMLDIQADLQADIPGARVDGLVSRQFETGIGVVEADRAAGTLGNVLIVELGTNGTVTSSDFDAMMQAASGVARVVFVNVDVPRQWEAADNAVLAAGVARYPGVAVLADWNALSRGHPEWFTADQVHLQPAGAQALANLVAEYA